MKFMKINLILYMKNIVIFILCLFLFSCEEDRLSYTTNEQPNKELSAFEKAIQRGMSIKLEQIYLMSGKNTIPILDSPVEELFKNNQTMINLIYQKKSYIEDYILSGLIKGEIWDIEYHEIKGETVYWEQGYGSTYQIVSYTPTHKNISLISTNNPYSQRFFLAEFDTDGVRKYRGQDEYTLKINSYNNDSEEWEETNLVLTVLVDALDDGMATDFEKGYLYFDSNKVIEFNGYYVEMPLTGAQVKAIVDSGVGYEVVAFNGNACIKIGNNYYIPTIGNTYRYIASDKNLGMINGYVTYYYRFKFKII